MNVIYPFGEGPTDQVVFYTLKKALEEAHDLRFEGSFVSVGGKERFREQMINKLEPEFDPGQPGRYVRVLAFRDLDAGEERRDVATSFEGIARQLLARRELEPQLSPLDDWPNLFVLDQAPNGDRPGLRLVLHIANPPALEDLALRNVTTDCYVLALALQEPVLARFAQGVSSQSNTLHALVTQEVPQAISNRGIACDEDKDFLAAYLCAARFWTVGRTEEKERLLNVVLARALRYAQDEFWAVFASWKTAIEEAMR